MRQIDKVLIRVGRSFRAIDLADDYKDLSAGDAASDHQRRTAGASAFALIGTLLAETKLSNKGIGFLIIKPTAPSTCRACMRC